MSDEHTTPSSETIKLIIDKALLESEARTAASISTTLADQNKTYMTEIVSVTTKVATLTAIVDGHTERIKGFKGLVATVSSVTGVLGGLIGFFVSQMSNLGK